MRQNLYCKDKSIPDALISGSMHIYKVVIEYDFNLWKYITTTTTHIIQEEEKNI